VKINRDMDMDMAMDMNMNMGMDRSIDMNSDIYVHSYCMFKNMILSVNIYEYIKENTCMCCSGQENPGS
jgi:hypothetical protein